MAPCLDRKGGEVNHGGWSVPRFAVSKPAHVNLCRSRLDERGLTTGPWLQELKRAIVAGEADDHPIRRFAAADAAAAKERAHLTTLTAGEIARAAAVRRVEPFHFSPRYAGEEERMVAEVLSALEAPEPAPQPA